MTNKPTTDAFATPRDGRDVDAMRITVSPAYLTYYMMKWDEVKQQKSNQRCTRCGSQMMQTEPVTDEKGLHYVGYVCHDDKQVTWVRAD